MAVYIKAPCGNEAIDLWPNDGTGVPPIVELERPEFDHTILCEPVANGARVIVTTHYDPVVPPIVQAFDMNGAAYSGIYAISDLVSCPDIDLESDALEICIEGLTQAYQWVVKQDGVPNGDVYYTALDGTILATPTSGTFVHGSCQVQDQNIQGPIIGTDLGDGSCVYQFIRFNTITGLHESFYTLPDGVTPVTLSGSFTPEKTTIDTEQDIVYFTNRTVGDAEEGRVVQVTQINDLVRAPGATQSTPVVAYWNMAVTPPVDVTALVTVAPFTDFATAAPTRHQYQPSVNVSVAGIAGVPLASVPTFATYAEIYIDVAQDGSDAGVRWTIDGSVPTDGNGDQEAAGSTIRLYGREQIDGFNAVPINPSTGAIDAAATASLTVTYWNVDEDDDG